MAFPKLLNYEFVRFLLVGVLNAIFGYSVFALLIYFGVHYTLAVFFGTILGILFNFQTVGRLVFKAYKSNLIWKFCLVYGITYILNILGIYILRSFNLSDYIAGALMVLPVAVLGFMLNSKFVFRT